MGFFSSVVDTVTAPHRSILGGVGEQIFGGPLGGFSDMAFGTNFYGTDKQIDFGRETNQMNREIAREQMAFQERMANSAYQRQIVDLKKAGLNPVLGIMKGQGASTPAGASIAAQNPAQGVRVGGAGVKSISDSVATAKMAKRIDQEVKSMDQNIRTNKALERKAKNEADVARANYNIRRVDQFIKEQTQSSAIQAQNEQNELLREHAKHNKGKQEFDSWAERVRQFIPFTSGRNKRQISPGNSGSAKGRRQTYDRQGYAKPMRNWK